jgi:anti-anti-sigma regulatory factor
MPMENSASIMTRGPAESRLAIPIPVANLGFHESPAEPAGRGGSAMNLTTAILEIKQKGEILVLKPTMDLHALDEFELDGAVHELAERMDESGLTDVFLDLDGTDVLHSQAPQLAVELWKRVRRLGGSMAICAF